MKALAIFPHSRDIRIVQVPDARLESPGEVLIRPLEVGICGTDRELVRFQFGDPPPGLEYLILGHETIGEVVEVRGDAGGFRKGDLVVPTVRRPCTDGSCVPCRREQSDMCFTGAYTERGIKEASGYMTELFVESPEFLTRIPAELRSVGVLLEPLTVTEKALLELDHIQRRLPWHSPEGTPGGVHTGRSALVLGAGPIGFLAALALQELGMRTFLASRNDPDDPKIRILDGPGIRYFSSRAYTPAEIRREIGNVDVLFEAAGSSELAFEYLPILGINGIYVLTGVPGPGKQVTIDGDVVMRRMVLMNQVVLGVVNSNIEAFRRGVVRLGRLARRYPAALEAMITLRTPLESYQRPLTRKERGEIKTVLTI